MKRSLAIDIICGLLILLFLYTAIAKLAGYNAFKSVLHKSPLIANFSGTIAWALPLTEIIIVCLLFIPYTKLTGLYVSLVSLIIFTLYLIYMLSYTPQLPCSCGGVLQNMSWKQHVFFNIGFTLLSLTGIILKSNNKPKKKPFYSTPNYLNNYQSIQHPLKTEVSRKPSTE